MSQYRRTPRRKTARVSKRLSLQEVKEIRAQLGDFEKALEVVIPKVLLEGDWAEVKRKVEARAKVLGFKTFSLKEIYRKYENHWYIIGTRPYTDEELQADGKRILASKVRKEAQAAKVRAKKVEKFNSLAAELGQELIQEDGS